MYYQIKETLTPCSAEDIYDRKPGDPPYVVIIDPETWNRTKDRFDMVIDMDLDPSDVLETQELGLIEDEILSERSGQVPG